MFETILNKEFKFRGNKLSAKTIVSHPLFSGSSIMILGSLAANAINYVYHLIMGRALGPVDYGKLATIFSLLYIVSVVPISSGFAIVKFISTAKDKKERDRFYSSIRAFFTKLALALSIIWILISGPVSRFLHIEEKFSILMVSAVIFINLIILVNQSYSQGLLKFQGVVGPNITSSLGKLVIGLILVYLGFSVDGAIAGVVLGAVLAYYYSIYFIKKNNMQAKETNGVDLKPFLKYAFPVLLQALAFTSIFTVDLILVKHFLPEFDAGLYAALSTLGKIIYFAAQPISSVMFPIVAGRKAKGEKYRNIFYLTFLFTILISFLVVFSYYLFPGIAIGLLYGKAYLAAKTELVWMGIFIGLYSLCYFLVNFLLSLHKTKIVILPFITAIVQIALIWYKHNTIKDILIINSSLVFILLISLVAYLGYNELSRKYAKRI